MKSQNPFDPKKVITNIFSEYVAKEITRQLTVYTLLYISESKYSNEFAKSFVNKFGKNYEKNLIVAWNSMSFDKNKKYLYFIHNYKIDDKKFTEGKKEYIKECLQNDYNVKSKGTK